MICKQVLDIIDAGPLARLRQAQHEAASAHARECASCGAALKASTMLEAGLRTLPMAASPEGLFSDVMSRVARLERSEGVEGPARTPIPESEPGRARPEWWAGSLFAGSALVMTVAALTLAPSELLSPRLVGTAARFAALPATVPTALGLAVGLILFTTGLFAPLSPGKR